MRRAHSPRDEAVTRREHRKHLRIHGWPKEPVDCPCDVQANRFRKKDAHDCGRARCGICHFHKMFGHEETLDEKLSRQRMKEQLEEV